MVLFRRADMLTNPLNGYGPIQGPGWWLTLMADDLIACSSTGPLQEYRFNTKL